jgi:hypothetical protein
MQNMDGMMPNYNGRDAHFGGLAPTLHSARGPGERDRFRNTHMHGLHMNDDPNSCNSDMPALVRLTGNNNGNSNGNNNGMGTGPTMATGNNGNGGGNNNGNGKTTMAVGDPRNGGRRTHPVDANACRSPHDARDVTIRDARTRRRRSRARNRCGRLMNNSGAGERGGQMNNGEGHSHGASPAVARAAADGIIHHANPYAIQNPRAATRHNEAAAAAAPRVRDTAAPHVPVI